MEPRNKKLGTKKGVFVFGSKVANLYQYEVIADPSWNQGTKKQQHYAPRNEKPRTKKGVFIVGAKIASLYLY